jgi:DNA-binding winged helix-turn-helix (wHTH) protein/Tfp pilus assembly protein PilF
MAGPSRERVSFGPFELDAAERLLWRDGRPVSVPPKAFDVLIVLTERPGHLVSKDELLARAWPGVVVEENVLSVAIARLRSALGDEFRSNIQAVPGYGYRLVDVIDHNGDGLAGADPAEPGPLAADDVVATVVGGGDGALAVVGGSAPNGSRAWLAAGLVGGLAIVAAVLGIRLGDSAAVSGIAPVDAPGEALEAYARGRQLWESRRSAAIPEALTQFKRAAALDPDFAPAYAGQALVYAIGYRTGGEAEAAAAIALDLDPSLAEAWAARGFARAFQEWDWEGARDAFETALALDPLDVTALQWYASFLMAQRNLAEAEATLERAIRQAPDYAVLHADLCEARYYTGDIAGARAACDRAIALDPEQPFVANHRGWLDIAVPSGATAARQRLAWQTHEFSASTRARLHARLGGRDSAMTYVRLAVQDRVLVAPFMRPDPLFDPYRGDPRWVAAMREMGLGP